VEKGIVWPQRQGDPYGALCFGELFFATEQACKIGVSISIVGEVLCSKLANGDRARLVLIVKSP
jgi:hypothetical protein